MQDARPRLWQPVPSFPDLAALNRERFQAFDPDPGAGTVAAAFAFAGDVYQGLKARGLKVSIGCKQLYHDREEVTCHLRRL